MRTDPSSWIDITVPITSGMVHWPGDPEPNFHRIAEIGPGSEANITVCRMPAHTGTHMDAPAHFLAGGQSIEHFPLTAGIGPARVVHLPDSVSVITQRELEPLAIQPGERVLFRTRNSNQPWDRAPFRQDYVGLDASAARLLVNSGALLIGVDYLSVGVFQGDGGETHRTLLSGGIWIVEGLRLAAVEAGAYELICLPLPIAGSDGSPVRAALRPLSPA